jgi:hypothetical protein
LCVNKPHKSRSYLNHLVRTIFKVPSIEIGLHTQPAVSMAELHLYGLIGKVSHPDMQKIRMTGFFFENRLHW